MVMSGRIVTALVLLLVLMGTQAWRAGAQGDETFTLSIGGATCDVNPFEIEGATCEPAGGIVVTVALESGEFVGSCTLETFPTPNGRVASGCGVEGVPFNSTLIIAEDPATIPAGFVPVNSPQTFVVEDLIPGGGDGPVISFINVAQEGDPGETPSEEPAAPEPTAAPSTTAEPDADAGNDVQDDAGRPASIYTGSCDDLGAVEVELTDVLTPQGEPIGQASAIEAESSGSTTVDASLDLLIDPAHAVAVLESDEADAPVIACGDIGGVDSDDGILVIGLSEVDGSDFTGIAYLENNGEDGERTDVSIFLAAGLADDAETEG